MKWVIRSHNEGLNFVNRACIDLGQSFDYPQSIEIKPFKPPRSQSQNAKFHAMIRELAMEIGYADSELKDWFKWEFGAKRSLTLNGHERLIPKSTTEYNKAEMSDLIAQIERVGAEMGFRFSHELEETS